MNEERISELFEQANAIVTGGHFVYTSGKHGGAYVSKEAICMHPVTSFELCAELANRFLDFSTAVDIVVSPAVGAITLAHVTAYHLSQTQHREILGCYAEKELIPVQHPSNPGEKAFVETGTFVFRDVYKEAIYGKNVLIIEDILNTGGSGKKVVEATQKAGGIVVGFGALCNRGGVTRASLELDESHTFFSLTNVNFRSYNEADCPLCQQNIPIDTRLGKGKEFLARRQKS